MAKHNRDAATGRAALAWRVELASGGPSFAFCAKGGSAPDGRAPHTAVLLKEYSVSSNKSIFPTIPWGAWIVVAAGGVLFLLGVGRFVQRHHFGLMDALYCCLALIPAGLLLLVISYVVQHAKLAAVVPLALAAVLVFSSPILMLRLAWL